MGFYTEAETETEAEKETKTGIIKGYKRVKGIGFRRSTPPFREEKYVI